MAMVNESIHNLRFHAEKVSVTYELVLEDYSSLEDHYAKGSVAPQFEIPGTGKLCGLYFRYSAEKTSAYLVILFPCDVEYHTVKMEASIINECGRAVKSQKKLITVPTPTINTAEPYTQYDFPLIRVSEITTTKGCLCNDTLRLRCQITVFKKILKTELETINQVSRLTNDVCKKFIDFLKEETLSDVVVLVEGTEFPAHKIILAANSPVFEAMFNTEMAEGLGNTVTITDTKPATFQAFLEYMYTGSIDKMDEHIANLLVIADKYEVRNLKEMCEKYIVSHLVSENVIEYLLLAHTHGFENLEQKALSVAINCEKNLPYSKDFDKLCSYPELMSKFFCKKAT